MTLSADRSKLTNNLSAGLFATLYRVALQDFTFNAGDRAIAGNQFRHAMAKPHVQHAFGGRFTRFAFIHLNNAGPGAPRDVEPGHRIAMTVRI